MKRVSMKPKTNFKIGKHIIGNDKPCFIVAEIGINYDGEREKALKMIDAAAAAGCDAVKFQIFKSERMYAKNAGSLKVASGKKVKIHELIKSMELPHEWLKELKRYAEKAGLEFFASVCDEGSADVLENTGTVAYKIASYEMTHLPLIEYVSGKKKPLIISCGGATMAEVEETIRTAQKAGADKIVLMHCVSKYDAPLNTLNLNVIKTLRLQFPELIIGYSDHSAHPTKAPIAAVTLGAKMVEKHITLDRSLPGPDHSFALEPKELKKMVQAIRETEEKLLKNKKVVIDAAVLGTSQRGTYPDEEYVRKFAYRLVYVTAPIKKGERFTTKNIEVLRSGDNYKKYLDSGLHPRYYKMLIENKVISKNTLKPGEAVTWKNILST
jgi:sialic acid synthase SpsE